MGTQFAQESNQTRAAGPTIAPEDERVVFRLILGGDEKIVSLYLWLSLQGQIPAVHFELLAEVVVAVKGLNFVLNRS